MIASSLRNKGSVKKKALKNVEDILMIEQMNAGLDIIKDQIDFIRFQI